MNLHSLIRHRTLRGASIGLLISALIVGLNQLGFFEPFELKTYDWRCRLFSSPEAASHHISIIVVDQKSLDYYEEVESIPWPWPRGMYEAVIAFANRGGARAIVFDILFTERSGFGYEDDETFAGAVQRAGNVYMPFFLSKGERAGADIESVFVADRSLEVEDESGLDWIAGRSVTLPIDDLVQQARGMGNVTMAPDGDGVYRRVPLLFRFRDHFLPSLPLAVARDVLETDLLRVDSSRRLHVGHTGIPLGKDATMLVKYHGGARTYRYFSIGSVIQSLVKLEEGEEPVMHPEEFKDSIVLVGLVAPGLYDLKPIPLSSVYPGVEVHATVIDNILNSDFMVRINPILVIMAVVVLNLLCGVMVSRTTRLALSLPLLCLLAALVLAVGSVAFQHNLWTDVVAPEMSILFTFALTSVVSYATEGKQRRFIKDAFRQYLSPVVIDDLLKEPDRLRLGGERKELTVFFSDLAGFTTISETLDPEQLSGLLNEYLSLMTDIIMSSGGTLDKYEGDAIIAFWGAPLPYSDHARRACLAALDCQAALERLRVEFAAKGRPQLFMRIGINSGEMVVGNMGSRERFDYTVIGDQVNLGSRLEGVNKAYGTFIMISESTYRQAQEAIEVRELDLIRVKGKGTPVRVYELLGRKGSLSPETRDLAGQFQQGLSLYREGKWKEAAATFERFPGDPPSAVFLDRCRALLSSPPGPDWDGIYEMLTK